MTITITLALPRGMRVRDDWSPEAREAAARARREKTRTAARINPSSAALPEHATTVSHMRALGAEHGSERGNPQEKKAKIKATEAAIARKHGDTHAAAYRHAVMEAGRRLVSGR